MKMAALGRKQSFVQSPIAQHLRCPDRQPYGQQALRVYSPWAAILCGERVLGRTLEQIKSGSTFHKILAQISSRFSSPVPLVWKKSVIHCKPSDSSVETTYT